MAKRTYQCKVCGKPFHYTDHNASYSYCSDTCKAAWLAIHNPPSLNVAATKQCERCGKEFETEHRGWKRFCSTVCQQKNTYEKTKGIIRTSPYYQRRFSILARDGFRCRYCGRSAQEDGVKLQVDHIMPKEKGGADEPANLITACQECNTGKSNLLLLAKAGQIPSYLTIESLTKLPEGTTRQPG